jgi:ADP-heptose:LPS heptosyltransferase
MEFLQAQGMSIDPQKTQTFRPLSGRHICKLILKNFQSPGDIVMLTAAVRDLHRTYPNSFITDVRTSCPHLWENNPYITPLDETASDVEIIECHYPLIHRSNQAPHHFVEGFIEYLNERLGLRIRLTEFRGDIHISALEKSWISQVQEITRDPMPFWLIAAGGKYDYTIKWWDHRRYQAVVDHFRGKIQFVQVGEQKHYHPRLNGVIDLRGKTDLRQLVRLVYHSQGVLTPVSLSMHLAAAVEVPGGKPKNRPCVVIAGGREPPHWEAYPQHQFLHTVGALPCCDSGGCWKSRTVPLGDGDEKDRSENLCVDVVGKLPHCMDMIEPADVIRRIETYFGGGAIRYLNAAQSEAARRVTPWPSATICVLTYGDYPDLAARTIESIRDHCQRSEYRLVVGGNAVGKKTQEYLERMRAEGAIDSLILSPENINKSPMMRRMFEQVDTEFIWWFDDDSYISDRNALSSRLEVARRAGPETVLWGHQFFFGHERDFSYGEDVDGFVRSAPWYRGKEPPSWKPGGKGETDFQGQKTGDGRWFFITGGCWFIRSAAVRALGWPDARLIKRNDDVFLSEAVRQQGWKIHDIGPLGVAINTEPRRGHGEDANTMQRQIGERQIISNAIHTVGELRGGIGVGNGCVFLPTFRDTDLLEENYSNRPELTRGIDYFVFDDNYDPDESRRVRDLCERNGWRYRSSGRSRHGDLDQERDLSSFNRFVWDSMMELGSNYDCVIKMDVDAYIIDPSWHQEFTSLLWDKTAIAGTPEMRPSRDVMSFWKNADRHFKKSFKLPDHIMHIQGGIFGLSRKALSVLAKAGFMEGEHISFAEDCYLSYSCRILGVDFLECSTVGSWYHPYRPKLESLQHLKAIHPLTRSDWECFSTEYETKCRPTQPPVDEHRM